MTTCRDTRSGLGRQTGLKAFGFDHVLLLHFVVRGRNRDGALSPFPMDDRKPFTAKLRRHVLQHLDRSCGWVAIRWAQDGREGGHGYNEVFDMIRPPALHSTHREAVRRQQIVRWLSAQPQHELQWPQFKWPLFHHPDCQSFAVNGVVGRSISPAFSGGKLLSRSRAIFASASRVPR
jgi:hypothetical protein